MKINLIITLLFLSQLCFGQKKVIQTFKDTRVINSHSVETLQKGKLDLRITHRFGDLAGAGGGWQTFFGLENASDVLMGFEYGMSNNWMVGISRTKGDGTLRQNINLMTKIRILQQEEDKKNPFSLAFVGLSSISTTPSNETPGTINFFDKFLHRVAYHFQMVMGSKISKKISIQGTAAWTYRNIVPVSDKNDLVSLGFAARYQLSKAVALIFDGVFPIAETRKARFDFYPATGFGLEWETGGGHVFQLNLTNARGIMETDFIPNSKASWSEGEFRIGFTISRLFTI